MADGSIEYSWGKLKYEHRHRNSKFEQRKSGPEFMQSISGLINDSSILPMERIWKFQRRSRDYMRLYMDVACSGEEITHELLETMEKTCKANASQYHGARKSISS